MGEEFFVELKRRLASQHDERKTVVISLVAFQLHIRIFYAVEASAFIKPLLIYPVDSLYLSIMSWRCHSDPLVPDSRLLTVHLKYRFLVRMQCIREFYPIIRLHTFYLLNG